MKEHVLISIFANAGSAFGSGSAYAVGIVTIIKAFYHRKISFIAGWLLITTTQVRSSLFMIFYLFIILIYYLQTKKVAEESHDFNRCLLNF
jgi:hypothetical protein